MGILKFNLKFLVLVPMTFVFLGNAFFLLLSNAPILLIANLLFYGVSVFFALILLKRAKVELDANLQQIQDNMQTLNFSAGLLKKEIQNVEDPSPQVDVIYNELKELTILCLNLTDKTGANGKEFLIVAKRLGSLCVQLKQLNKGKDDQFEKVILISENLNEHTKRMTRDYGIEAEVLLFKPNSLRNVLNKAKLAS